VILRGRTVFRRASADYRAAVEKEDGRVAELKVAAPAVSRTVHRLAPAPAT
jgi:hypothetical protein